MEEHVKKKRKKVLINRQKLKRIVAQHDRRVGKGYPEFLETIIERTVEKHAKMDKTRKILSPGWIRTCTALLKEQNRAKRRSK